MDIILAEVQIYQIAFFFATLFSLLGGIAYFFFRLLKKKSSLQNTSPNDKPESWGQRLSRGLEKSREEVWGKLSSLISSSQLSEEQIEEIEELLYSADMGATLVEELKDSLKVFMKKNDVTSSDLKNFLYDFLFEKLNPVQKSVSMDLLKYQSNQKLKVIMIVGVNGAGKTTTIGKLATKLKNQGAKVVVGACDTFRAGAVDQLQVWCDRAQVTMIRAKEGNDPSGVAFEALESAKKMGADYCLLDTAGRLHTAKNLMEELKKTKRVLSKIDESAPHEILLVIDAITGQNALRQAEEFHQALGLTGLIFTKCDGSAKAGNAVTIVQKLKVPIAYIGVGESVEDLDVFNSSQYLNALLGLAARA